MKDIRYKSAVGAMAVCLVACGFLNEKKSNQQRDRGQKKTPMTASTVSEDDVAKMPRNFSESESVVIPGLNIEKEIKEHPENLRFYAQQSFAELVRARALICSLGDNDIAGILKKTVKDNADENNGQPMGSFLALIFPPAQGHFVQSRGSDPEGYIESDEFASDDAKLIRAFYCLGNDPAQYVDRRVQAFELLATPETLARVSELNLADNLGVDCAAEIVSGDRIMFSARWNPNDAFVRGKLPSMQIEWLADGEVVNTPAAIIDIGTSLKQELKRSQSASIYSARLSDRSGRISLTCARLMVPEDDSVAVEPRQDAICGQHTEKRSQAVDYQVEIDAGFRDAPRMKTYETTCGGSVEPYHTSCDAGELMVENSHHNITDECLYKKEVCVGGGLIPRVCQEIPEMRHRNKGSVLCQNQTRATKTETRTRIEMVDVSVSNTCDVPFKK